MSPENFGSDKKYFFIEFFLSCNLLNSYYTKTSLCVHLSRHCFCLIRASVCLFVVCKQSLYSCRQLMHARYPKAKSASVRSEQNIWAIPLFFFFGFFFKPIQNFKSVIWGRVILWSIHIQIQALSP